MVVIVDAFDRQGDVCDTMRVGIDAGVPCRRRRRRAHTGLGRDDRATQRERRPDGEDDCQSTVGHDSVAPFRAQRLRNDDRVAWFQRNILLGVLLFDDVPVVEWEVGLTSLFGPDDHDVLGVGIFQKPAGAGNEL